MPRGAVLFLLSTLPFAVTGFAQAPEELGVIEFASNIPGVGARALGMAGAFTAIADDATAATWNPAGLAHLTRPEASLVYESVDGDIDPHGLELAATATRGGEPFAFESFSLVDETGGFDDSRLSFLSATYPLKAGGRPLVLQASARRLLRIPGVREDRRFRHQASLAGLTAEDLFSDSSTVSFSGGIDLFSASAGYEARDGLRVGLTLNYLDGDYTVRQEYGFSLAEAQVRGSQREVLKESFAGWFADLGVQWDLGDRWVLGAVVHTGFSTGRDFSDTLTASETGAVFLGPSVAGGRGRVRWPESYAVGIAFKPNDRVRLAADFAATRWSQGERDVFVFAEFQEAGIDADGNVVWVPVQVAETDLSFPNFDPQEDTRALRLGGEVLFFAGPFVVPLRAGAFEEDAMIGAFAEFNQAPRAIRGFTLGTGLTYEGYELALAWVHSESAEDILVSEASEVPTAPVPITVTTTAVADHFRVSSDRLIASLIFRF